MHALKPALMSVEDFLPWTLAQPEKWELVDGVPIKRATRMKAGGTVRHARLSANIIGVLHNKLRGGPCAAHTSDLLVQSSRAMRYPDVTVDCGANQAGLVATVPRVLFEVLSPSNNAFKQMRLAADYQAIDSVEQIIFINQDAIAAQVWTRTGNAWAVGEVDGLIEPIELPSIGCVIALAEIYDGVRLDLPG